MDLEKLTIQLRSRTAWEALDLGFVLARQSWGPLLCLWLCTALPVFMATHAAGFDNPWLTLFLLWWLKPLYEKAPLVYLSRLIFGQRLSWHHVMLETWRLCRRHIIGDLIRRRLDRRRGFTAAIRLLEQDPASAHARVNILSKGVHVALYFTSILVQFELVMTMFPLMLLVFVVPEGSYVYDVLFFDPASTALFWTLSYFVAMGVVAPFYMAAGFTLYINRRVDLEAWDVELDLRRIVKRRQAGRVWVSFVIVLGFAVLSHSHSASATTTREPVTAAEAKRLIEEISAQLNAGTERQRTTWRYRSGDDRGHAPVSTTSAWWSHLGEDMSVLVRVALWIGIAGLVVWLAVGYPRWSRWLREVREVRVQPKMPTVAFGMELAPGSLPADVAEHARQLIAAGEMRAALSLLYRGAIVCIVTRYALVFVAGATEGECMRQVTQTVPASQAQAFSSLAACWQRIAYGHRAPDATQALRLCDDWTRCFGVDPS